MSYNYNASASSHPAVPSALGVASVNVSVDTSGTVEGAKAGTEVGTAVAGALAATGVGLAIAPFAPLVGSLIGGIVGSLKFGPSGLSSDLIDAADASSAALLAGADNAKNLGDAITVAQSAIDMNNWLDTLDGDRMSKWDKFTWFPAKKDETARAWSKAASVAASSSQTALDKVIAAAPKLASQKDFDVTIAALVNFRRRLYDFPRWDVSRGPVQDVMDRALAMTGQITTQLADWQRRESARAKETAKAKNKAAASKAAAEKIAMSRRGVAVGFALLAVAGAVVLVAAKRKKKLTSNRRRRRHG